MEALTPDTLHITTATFRALYDAVSDMVFVYRISDGLIFEGNRCFRKAIGVQSGAPFSLPLAQMLPEVEQQSLGTSELADTFTFLQLEEGNRLPVHLRRLKVLLEQELVCIGVASDQGAADAHKLALAAAEQEKKALLKEVYHRVKNNLNIIVSLISLQLNRVQEPELRQLLTESKGRVHSLALLQERLYHSPRLSEVKANEYLASLVPCVIGTYKESRQQIRFVPDTQECWLNVDVLVPLGLIVHEVVANAVQHAYKGAESGEIHLYFACSEAGVYQLMIEDTGKGLPEGTSFTSFNSLGVQLITSLSRQLKAKLQVDSTVGRGTKISLVFSLQGKHA